MKLLFSIVLSWCSYSYAERVDDMYFTCRSHAGCEVFEICTKHAMTRLHEQVVELIDSKLQVQKYPKALPSVKAASATPQSTDKDLEELLSKAHDEVKRKTDELHSKVNHSISILEEAIYERMSEGQVNLRELIKESLEESEIRLFDAIENTQLHITRTREKEIEKLKSETEKMMLSRLHNLSQRWNDDLEETRNIFTLALSEALSSMDQKIKQVDAKVGNVSKNVNEAMREMNADLDSRLRNAVKGNASEITRDEVQQMIEANLKEASFGWGSYYEDLNSYDGDSDFIEQPKHNISVTRRGVCKVSYLEKCFWIVEPELAVSYQDGAYECERRGGEVANVYSKTHLDMLKVYMRSLISPKRMYIDVWTGMTIDTQTEEVFYTNGSMATFLEWEPGSPASGRSFLSWSSIYVIAKKDIRSLDQGMVNSSPESIRDGVLCEL